ncbi:MAG: LuxR family transcriptional regulator, partial [Bacteroidota bacterium]|nr:LuxR family transcriptional regulator [Bacteroidota bacterium]
MNQDIQFIQTKINLPQLRANHLKRPRLLEKLNNVYDYRLVTVTAPAGFGKTTFLTAWVNAAGLNRKTAFSWLSLDEYDNEPEFFWTYFLMSFHKTVEPICQILKNVSLFQNQNSIYKAGISFLINEISNMNSEFVAVLDDFHVISDASILEGMKFLIRNMPPNMHVVISGRSMPELGTARLRAADSLMEFKKEDLSFTSEESNEFISDVMGLSFDKGKTALLNQETEGWAAGLQMAALSIKNSKAEDINGILNSSKRFAFDYIAEEVFCGLEENIKKFLMYTSILDEFSAKICDYILETSGSSRFINQIESQNLFVSALDNEKNWFCYHNLFRNFLRTRLECENMCITKKLYIRASEWYENQNLMNKAINFSIKGCNYDNAVRLIEKISPDILCRGEAKLLHKWNGSLPNEVVLNNPRLLINSAWGVYSDGKTGEIETYTEAARKLLSGCTDEKSMEQMKAEITALSVNFSKDVKYQDSIVDDCRYALKHLDENEFLTQLIIFNMANAYLLKGNLPEAIKLFEKCLDSSIRVGNYYIAIISNKALSTSRKWYGQYNEAEENCLMLINALKQYHVEVFSTSGILYAELADLYYQRNNLD